VAEKSVYFVFVAAVLQFHPRHSDLAALTVQLSKRSLMIMFHFVILAHWGCLGERI